MSVKVMQWVWEHSRSKGNDRLVLLAISDNAHEDGGGAFLRTETLCRKTGLSERTIQVSTKRLADLGELKVYLNAGPGGVNRFRVIMTPAESAPPQNLHPADTAPPPQNLHPTPAESAGVPPQILHPTPAESAPVTVIEPSVEPSGEPRDARASKAPRHAADDQPDQEPPKTCPKHRDTQNPPPCGPCKDHRSRNETWQAARRARINSSAKCPRHIGELAHNCGPCRSEAKSGRYEAHGDLAA